MEFEKIIKQVREIGNEALVEYKGWLDRYETGTLEELRKDIYPNGEAFERAIKCTPYFLPTQHALERQVKELIADLDLSEREIVRIREEEERWVNALRDAYLKVRKAFRVEAQRQVLDHRTFPDSFEALSETAQKEILAFLWEQSSHECHSKGGFPAVLKEFNRLVDIVDMVVDAAKLKDGERWEWSSLPVA